MPTYRERLRELGQRIGLVKKDLQVRRVIHDIEDELKGKEVPGFIVKSGSRTRVAS